MRKRRNHAKRFSAREDSIIREYYSLLGAKIIAGKLGRSDRAISMRASNLGVKYKGLSILDEKTPLSRPKPSEPEYVKEDSSPYPKSFAPKQLSFIADPKDLNPKIEINLAEISELRESIEKLTELLRKAWNLHE